MSLKYTVEPAQQMLISLLKRSGIKRIIASPGTTNLTLVGSLMHDPWFEIYSAPDERSGAYMACGMAAETGEPIVISCTGATASRNYLPAITEAHYRKLPILAVTATQNMNLVGHLIPQVMDRSVQLKDTYIHTESIPVPRNGNDMWEANVKLNRAILALTQNGGGPVLINLATDYNSNYSAEKISTTRKINRYFNYDSLPALPAGRVGIRVGNHHIWSKELTEAVDNFCSKYDGVVFCEHGSNYAGNYRVYNAMLNAQSCGKDCFKSDLIIHIGETGSYGLDSTGDTTETWRVNEDGELRDTMRKLTNVFQMREIEFFQKYAEMKDIHSDSRDSNWLQCCKDSYQQLNDMLKEKELPFSNMWIAQQTAHRIPANSVLHVGILHSQRCWSMFDTKKTVQGYSFSNTGGFGIDGCMSTIIGGSIILPDKLHFLIIGDLAFFYDLNSLGNKHIGSNLRIMLINNGRGTEFRNYGHPAYQFGDEADEFIAAAHHYGNQSPDLVKHYAMDLRFKYLQAKDKSEFLNNLDSFLSTSEETSPIIFEVFTNHVDESDALKEICTLLKPEPTLKDKIKEVLPNTVVQAIKKIHK